MPTSLEAIGALLFAIVPGYLAVSVWARARTWKGPAGDLRTVLQAVTASAIVHLLISPLTIVWLLPHRDELDQFPERVALWAALVVLVIPLVLGGLASRAGNRWPTGRQGSGWDWLFTQQPPHEQFVVVEFKDGRRVAGVFADGAMAHTSPDKHGLFLRPEWQMDEAGEFVRELPGTAGVLITATDDIRWVRVLDSGAPDGEE